MLRLENIVKDYKVGQGKVRALKGINLAFRKNEFVSILGPSGCGKTTTLNIIGGLDKYTSGDLKINGVSTKEFKLKDWDVYRNHRVGFIFQSYNLIPHQTVLSNVELSLTIAGVSKEERTKRAKEALDRVGLAGEYNKKPNQLSGGQSQRVAIARALVNEPEILLADEPTGALDSKTSVQIMELIKEIANDRLVIMVTHNAELAEKYSTRIINLLDGEVISDSNPYSPDIEAKEEKIEIKNERAKMSLLTSFKLSFKNLLSKSKRTILTCIAGSIGIVGVSLVLAFSSGIRGYINHMEDDMLSGNPIQIREESYDMNSYLGSMSNKGKLDILKKEGFVNVNSLIEYFKRMIDGEEAFFIKNVITDDYIKYLKAMPDDAANTINFRYDVSIENNIYTDYRLNDKTDEGMVNTSLTTISTIYNHLVSDIGFAQFSQMITGLSETMYQMLPNEDYVLTQYDMVSGKMASNKHELMIVLNDNDELTDLALAKMGYFSQNQFIDLAMHATNPSLDDKHQFSYDELLGKKFTYYPNDVVYTENNVLNKPFIYNAYSDDFAKDKGLDLEVVGILKPKDNIKYGSLTTGFYYTSDLIEYAISDALNSKIVAYQKNVLNGMNFDGDVDESSNNSHAIEYKYFYTNPFNQIKNKSSYLKSSTESMFSGMMPSVQQEVGPSLRELGGVNTPGIIEIYPLNFDEKFLVTDYLDKWNSKEDIVLDGITLTYKDRNIIKYNDDLEVMVSMINQMITMVTIALVAFTALSLVVSSVMIAIITYVSVMERVKEIGVIRSLGGRKKDVSNLFNAETFMIGSLSGLVGIIVTYLISLIVNLSLSGLTDGYSIAALPWYLALVMLLISILLTTISGFIPARSAAKKDPVEALRTE